MDESYHGFVNWETWNVDLWIDNIRWAYNAKASFLETTDHPVTAEEVKRFVSTYAPPSDLESDDWKKVDWEDLATNWEAERQIFLTHLREMYKDFEEVDDGEEM